MPYALVPLIDVRPSHVIKGGFERSPVGHEIPGSNWILLGKGDARRALIWTPEPIADARVIQLSDGKFDSLSSRVRTELSDFLGDRLFQSSDTFHDAVLSMLLNPPSERWGAIQPSRRRQRKEILLGPDAGKLFWSEPVVVPRSSVTYTDAFTGTNGDLTGHAFTGGTAAWLQRQGGEWEILSNAAACVNIADGTFSVEGTDTDVDSADDYAQAVLTLYTRAAGSGLFVGLVVRGDAFGGGGAGYGAEVGIGSGNAISNRIYDFADDSNYDTDTSDNPGTGLPKLKYLEIDGTTLRFESAGVEIMSATVTDHSGGAGNRKAAITSYGNGSSTTDVTVDDFETGDLVVGGTTVSVPARAHTYTANAPKVSASVQPSPATHSYTGQAPKFVHTLRPSQATHTYTGQAPQLRARVQPAARTHSYVAQAPQLRARVQPAQVTHTYTGQVPQVRARVQPAPVTHAYTGQVPIITAVSGVVAPTVTHTYTGRVPNIQAGLGLFPPVVTHAYSGSAPQLRASVQPGPVTHTYSAQAPQARAQVKPAQATHSYVAQAPKFMGSIKPGQATHTYTGMVPELQARVQPAPATHTYTGRVPNIATGGQVFAVSATHAYTVPAPKLQGRVQPGVAVHTYTALVPQYVAQIAYTSQPLRARIGGTPAVDTHTRIGSTPATVTTKRIGDPAK